MRKIQRIKEFFPEDKTSDDITLSYDQYDNLQDFIADPKKGHYPFLVGADDQVDFEEVVQFLLSLRTIFRWEEYERETLGKPQYIQNDGKPGGILRWYATILLRWIRGNGLRTIIRYAIDYKESILKQEYGLAAYKLMLLMTLRTSIIKIMLSLKL